MKNEDLFKGSTNSILFTHKIKELEKQQEDPMINQIIFKKYEVKKKIRKILHNRYIRRSFIRR